MARLKNQRRKFSDRQARIIRAKGLDVSRARRNSGASICRSDRNGAHSSDEVSADGDSPERSHRAARRHSRSR